jgi:hypothetical protein
MFRLVHKQCLLEFSLFVTKLYELKHMSRYKKTPIRVFIFSFLNLDLRKKGTSLSSVVYSLLMSKLVTTYESDICKLSLFQTLNLVKNSKGVILP